MLTEKQVADSLPSHGFLRSYVEYASTCTDANSAYHIAGALACLSQCVPEQYAVPYASPIYGNLYTMIVGGSSKSRKTASINIAQRILREAIPGAIGEVPGSQEGLYEALREHPRQLVVYGEWGEFLAKAEEGYMMPLKTAYTSLWDSIPIGRALASSRKGNIENPRLSLLCGVATDLLERHTEQADWTGGFLARFFTLHAEPEREYSSPPVDDPQRRGEMTRWLTSLASTKTAIGPCLWLDDQAKAMWSDWYEGQRPLREGASRRASAACARTSSIAAKLALLIAWDIGQARSGGPWRVSINELEPALKLSNLHLDSVLELGERVTGSRDMRDRASVLRAVADVPTPVGYILRESEMLKRRAKEILESLVEERAIRAEAVGNDLFYVRTPQAQAMLAQMVVDAKLRQQDGSRSNVVALPLRSVSDQPTVVMADAPSIDPQQADDIDWASYEG